MAYEQKEGDLSMFPNKNKSGNQPDVKGKALYHGEKVELSVWTKIDKNGNEYWVGKIQKQSNN